jgi:hypothetical protein
VTKIEQIICKFSDKASLEEVNYEANPQLNGIWYSLGVGMSSVAQLI